MSVSDLQEPQDDETRQKIQRLIADIRQRAFASPKIAREVDQFYTKARAEALRRIHKLPCLRVRD